MAIGLVGRKAGMTRLFMEDGASVAVTVIEVEANRIAQRRTGEVDGYEAIQVAIGERKASHTNQAQLGHFKKAGVESARRCVEFRLDGQAGDVPDVGGELTLEMFQVGQKVDVCGTSKGKGFQGGVKRHNFRTQDATHGNSLSHRAPGSIGQCQTPGRVFKGKKMAGHMGNVRTTTQSVELMKIDSERNLLLIKGSVPGAKGGDVIITPAVKAKNEKA